MQLKWSNRCKTLENTSIFFSGVGRISQFQSSWRLKLDLFDKDNTNNNVDLLYQSDVVCGSYHQCLRLLRKYTLKIVDKLKGYRLE